MIPRLYDVTEGVVRVGGADVRDYDLETLRNQVAVVLQKNVLFSGTIRENLRWGNPFPLCLFSGREPEKASGNGLSFSL